MSECTTLSVIVGKTITAQLELFPEYVVLTNKSPYDLQYSGYGTIGVQWLAAGIETKLYKEKSANVGVINLTAFNNAGITPQNPGIVLVTQYIPGENPKGTWPVAIPTQIVSGNVTVTSLSQEGNAPQVETIDIGDNTFSKLWDIFNDGHANIAVDQSGVKHIVITIPTSGNPLQLGQSTDITEVLGQLNVDKKVVLDAGTLSTDGSGDIIFNNNRKLQWKDTGGTVRTIMNLDNGDNVGILAAVGSTNGRIYFLDKNGVEILHLDVNGISLSEGNILINNLQGIQWKDHLGGIHNVFDVSNGDTLEIRAPANTTQWKSDDNTTNYVHINSNGFQLDQGAYGFLTGSISRVSVFSGTGTGTYNHNLGATPDFIALTTHTNGSQTMGYDSENGTTVHVTCGAGLAFIGLAIKG